MSPSFLPAARMTEKTGMLRNGLTEIALLGKELGQVINLQSAENNDGKPTPGGKVYARHGRRPPRRREGC
jgi:hypothetical protein